MKIRTTVLAIVVVLITFGNYGCETGLSPAIPPTISSKTIAVYTIDEFINDRNEYKKAYLAQNSDLALVYRNFMIDRMLADVESRYKQFANDLANNKAAFDTVADVIELGAAATTAAIGGEGAKTAIAVGLTAFKGSRISIDKNFFKEKTIAFITVQMDADRSAIKNQILLKMALPVTQYGFDEAYSDTIDFYWAGTVQSALESLAASSGQQAAQQVAETKNTTERRVNLVSATVQDIERRRALMRKVGEMTPQIALEILQALGVSDLATVTPDKAKERLANEVEAAGRDDVKLKRIEDEFKKH